MPMSPLMNSRVFIFLIFVLSLFGTACIRENKSTVLFDSINNPTLSFSINGEQLYTNTLNQELTITSDREIKSVSTKVSFNQECSNIFQTYLQGQKVQVNLLDTDQEQFVNVMIKSATGFPSKCISKKILVDSTPPVVGALSLNANRASRSRTPKVSPPTVSDVGSGVAAVQMRMIYKDGTVIRDWTEMSANSLFFSFSGSSLLPEATSADQTYQLQVRARDKAGNVSTGVVSSDPFLVGPSATLVGLDQVGEVFFNNQNSGGYVQFNLSAPAPANASIQVIAESSTAIEGVHFSYPTIVPVTVTIAEGVSYVRIYFSMFPSMALRWKKDEKKHFKMKILSANNIGLESDEVTIALLESRESLPSVIPSGYSSLTMMVKAGCAVNSAKILDCWGHYFWENFGTSEGRFNPQAIPGATDVARVYRANSTSICFSKTDDSLWCFGKNDGSVLGQSQSSLAKSLSPIRIGQGTPVDKVKKAQSSMLNICALNFSDELYCWGQDFKNVNPGSGGNYIVPTKIPNLTKVIDFSLTNGVACVIDEISLGNRAVKCWGDADVNTSTKALVNVNSSNMVTISGINELPVEISIGRFFELPYTGCVRTVNHKIYCWGNSNYGRRGSGSGTGQFLIANQAIINLTNSSNLTGGGLLSLAVGHGVNCVVTQKNELWCWGDGLRNPDNLSMIGARTEGVKMSGFDPIVMVNTDGLMARCALTNEGKIQCWGFNSFSEVGNGVEEFNLRSMSSRVYGSEKIRDVLTMDYSTCVVNLKDELRCWGRNTRGHLGISSSFDKNPMLDQPPTAPILTNVDQVKGKGRFICATTKDSKFFCWGDDETFQTLATANVSSSTGTRTDPTILYTNLPSEISLGAELTYSDGGKNPGFNSLVKDFDVSYNHACVLTQDNKIHCWGSNTHGQTCSNFFGARFHFPCINNSLPLGATPLRLSLGFMNTCVLVKFTSTSKQAIYCNGGFDAGIPSSQSGNTNTFIKIVEHDYTPTTEINKISISLTVGCYIYNKKTYCWGRGGGGPLPGTKRSESITWLAPQEVAALAGATSLSMSEYSACATMPEEGIKCWGLNLSGLTGAPTLDGEDFSPTFLYPFRYVPAKKVSVSPALPDLTSNEPFIRFEALRHYCAIGFDDILQCWGGSGVGEARSDLTHVLPTYIKKHQ